MFRTLCRKFTLLLPLSLALAGPVESGSAPQYPQQKLDELTERFQRGIDNNLKNIVWPVLTAEERAALGTAKVAVIPADLPDREPFAFHVENTTISVSANSMKFLRDIMLAADWLNRSGFSTNSLDNYAIAMHYGLLQGEADLPLAALCVPEESGLDPKIVDVADQAMANLTVLLVLHELGHIRFHHLDAENPTPEMRQQQEAEADNFALNVMARIGDAPLSFATVLTFYALSSLGPEDFRTDAEFAAYTEKRLHPLDEARMNALADSLNRNAERFGPTNPAGAASFKLLSLQIKSQLAPYLSDKGLRTMLAQRARTMSEAHFAPSLPGQPLGKPCAKHAPLGNGAFAGFYAGVFHAGNSDLTANALLRDDGDKASGIINFGSDDVVLSCQSSQEDCTFDWTWGEQKGKGKLSISGAELNGTWNTGNETEGGGWLKMTRQ